MTEPQVNDATLPAAPDHFPPTGNVDPEDYDTRGRTKVATKRGWRFAPADKDLPVVDHGGVQVTADQADALIEESDGLVFVVTDNKEGESADAR